MKKSANSDESIHSQASLMSQALKWTPEEWRHELSKLSPEDLISVIPAADIHHDPEHWKIKLAAAISGLNDRAHLEAAGRALSLVQSHEIFTYTSKDSAIIDKLSPIFVGMPHNIFCEVLFTLTKEELELLKQTAITEAIQHHLSLVCQRLEAELKEFDASVKGLGRKISTLPLADITHKEFKSLSDEIESQINNGFHSIKIANSALAIAWNTLRLDLIDQLSDLKEGFLRIIQHTIGATRTDESPSTGIYALLENRLNTIFTDTLSDEQILSMSDDAPAIEALVKFGIWYEQDYIDIGLLERNPTPSDTQLETPKKREDNYLKVTASLKSLGLITLKDLKQARIYSRKALQELIDRSSKPK